MPIKEEGKQKWPGLSTAEVAERIKKYGANEIVKQIDEIQNKVIFLALFSVAVSF